MNLKAFYRLRPMINEDIPAGMQLKEMAGWNQTEDDWSLLLDYPSKTHFIAAHQNQTIGTISTLHFPPGISWIGMVLVHPTHRRRGVASMLLRKIQGAQTKTNCFRLDATDEGAIVYEKLGYTPFDHLDRMVSASHAVLKASSASIQVLPMQYEHLPLIYHFDAQRTGYDRSELLKQLYHRHPNRAFLHLLPGGGIKGYCLGRPGSAYKQIGPLVADNYSTATALLCKAISHLRGAPMVVDVFRRHTAIMEYLLTKGFKIQRSFTRMQKGDPQITADNACIFASAGPELG